MQEEEVEEEKRRSRKKEEVEEKERRDLDREKFDTNAQRRLCREERACQCGINQRGLGTAELRCVARLDFEVPFIAEEPLKPRS